ncbi:MULTISPECIES: flagella synthesis protein FlgN [Brenneria]|uniref:Flagellar biosynthesis protein FlgN n=1 Tax=Brenneria nigrifluens DSM 30175 = ATCC 13028 TaxID=1121120 RepID=A0A2U1UUP1_9GAMM|nr:MULTISPECIES: flagellar export chaperone FlgN [Brenneria]EHD22043.1 FlgN family protein [Brenneria sp. EniD312]PWC25373.1 flagellar biosynthesis protein FlgN [Brenneria nigrifluens DSM 30175 = ATCC 13028]QCR05125.1 flagellar biosynthesis protein FlgN [Brenneria nigrifluens DSM 30175 = ATCC 13028]
MQKLQTILDKLLHNLDSLQAVMSEEQVQLCAGQINSSALQQVTEKKSSLLATMQYLEQCRHEEESLATLKAPYEGNEELAERWRQVQQLTKNLREQNQHNGLLLNQHISHTDKALEILKPRHGQSLYGPDGQAKGSSISGRKISI